MQSLYRPGQTLRVQEVEVPRFQGKELADRLYPFTLLVPISIRGRVDPRAIVQPERSCQ